jgi:RNA polymerase sigma-70 factor, ECF subfamily
MWRFDLSNVDTPLAALDSTFRRAYGRLVAALTRRLGAQRLELAEDAVQEALVRALDRWPRGTDLPTSIDGWLLRVAYNIAIDALRRESRLEPLAARHDRDVDLQPPTIDDELALIFLCCHPSLARSAQVALTLRIAAGLTPRQIGLAFLTNETTIAQRLVRAKQRLRQLDAPFEVPEPALVPERLDAVLDALYLMFAEGFSPSDGDEAMKDELWREALRLARLLTDQPITAVPAAEAMRALFCFQSARAKTRRADDGSLLLLSEQDRTRWDRSLIEEGFAALNRASRGTELSRFHVEAGIAACHAAAPTYVATDWEQILFLYDTLRARLPSPVVEVNRAVAVAMVSGAAAGLDELDSIPERELISRYPYALAAYADLHASVGHLEEARAYLASALEHQPAESQRRLIKRKLAALQP